MKLDLHHVKPRLSFTVDIKDEIRVLMQLRLLISFSVRIFLYRSTQNRPVPVLIRAD